MGCISLDSCTCYTPNALGIPPPAPGNPTVQIFYRFYSELAYRMDPKCNCPHHPEQMVVGWGSVVGELLVFAPVVSEVLLGIAVRNKENDEIVITHRSLVYNCFRAIRFKKKPSFL